MATIVLETRDGPMPAYEAVPDGTAVGAAIVIQEAFGVNDHIEDVTRRVAAAGYHAIAPHLFHRSGGGTVPYDHVEDVFKHLGDLSDDGMLVDLDATLDHLSSAGWKPTSVAAVGFCMGGRACFLLATSRHLGAASSFYGGGIVTARSAALPALLDRIAGMRTPWLGLFGDADQGIPVEDVETLRGALASDATVDWDIVRYPGAQHGFHCEARSSYDEASARDAWSRTLAWWERHLA